MKGLIIDNFDSFTFNLHHYVSEFTDNCDVIRNDKLSDVNFDKYNKIILSPGPSLPKDHSTIFKFLSDFAEKKSILGICLGHQAIAEYFGAKLLNLKKVKHGVTSENIIIKKDKVFQNFPTKFSIGHYHSWVVSKEDFPSCLVVTSENEEGFIMSISHKEFDVKGIQFHPESILTPNGKTIVKNWIFS